jgi:hypothetical protein
MPPKVNCAWIYKAANKVLFTQLCIEIHYASSEKTSLNLTLVESRKMINFSCIFHCTFGSFVVLVALPH